MTDDAIARYLEPEKRRVFKRDVMIYSRYERFWHWTQAALIFTLFFSGLGVRDDAEKNNEQETGRYRVPGPADGAGNSV